MSESSSWPNNNNFTNYRNKQLKKQLFIYELYNKDAESKCVLKKRDLWHPPIDG